VPRTSCPSWRRSRTGTGPRTGPVTEGVPGGEARGAEDGETLVGAVAPLGRVSAAGTAWGERQVCCCCAVRATGRMAGRGPMSEMREAPFPASSL
jgi:hypothetical protein